MQLKRLNQTLDFSDPKSNSIKFGSLDMPCMAPAMASAALYWTDSSFSHKKIRWKVGQRLYRRHNQNGVSKTLCR